MFSHHQAEFNIQRIIENLILLQDHYSTDPCADCCTKHVETIEAYAREGMALDHAAEYADYLKACTDLAERHLRIIVGCINDQGKCEIKNPKDMVKMGQETRALRRELNMAIFHLAGDLVYENEQAGSHDFMGHAHNHVGSEQGMAHEEPISA